MLITTCLLLSVSSLLSQDRLKTMPGYKQYKEMAPKIRQSVESGAAYGSWSEDGKTFSYRKNGEGFAFNVETKKIVEADLPRRSWRGWGNRPARGRQYASAMSPKGDLKAYTKDRNMYISDKDGGNVVAITSDGNADNQIKYGIATWVYGEELRQNTAMWWSPDGSKIAFYRFDEKASKKYYVLLNQVQIQDSLEIEAYPKVGAVNLPVDLMMYDLKTKKLIKLDTRDGKPFEDGPIGTYLYDISWTKDSKELLFHSTNRKQDVMEFKAANPKTGKTRVVVREEWRASFTKNSPEIKFLEDGKRFIWASERSGFNNYYLYNLSGKLLKKITTHDFEVNNIVKIDEKGKALYYMARSGENHMKMQLHKVGLNGRGDERLTDEDYNHTVYISPDNKYFVDISQTHNEPPFTTVRDMDGDAVAELAKSDMTEFKKLGFKTVEVFTFTSADGETELHGMLHFPSNFDPNKKYPLLLANYGGPSTNAFRETFTYPSALTEYGFLVANIDGRNVRGRGKELLDQLYGNLGIVEMDDFAAGIKSLYDRPYFDKNRVGVYGTSYGGTVAATSLLRFPDVYHAAVANSSVTDWRNYDNIYTERYMNLITNNKKGYDASNIMNYVDNLEGRLMIFFGTADNNVHPSNSLQLIAALQKARKSFEVQIGPDQGHTRMDMERMMEFFIENLVINPPKK